ncbi:MAG: phosphate ABC transporter ATP-binding protein PstB [Methylococcaceae bacterium]
MTFKLEASQLNLRYGKFHALKDVSISIRSMCITAIIGPSGCGKSTLLRCFNRMNDLIAGTKVQGQILLDGESILAPSFKLIELRKRVGMVFQRPNPFPLTVFENVAYGLRVHGIHSQYTIEENVESALRATRLWDDLKDKLHISGLDISPEQQQRLCISRLLAVEPEVLLMDEPCSALDPIATMQIEDLMHELAKHYTIVIVTHNMQQASRISDDTAFMLLGDLVEFAPTTEIFTHPKDNRTEAYVEGRYG